MKINSPNIGFSFVPLLQNSRILKRIAEILANDATQNLRDNLQEAFNMLNIDECCGRYLDNLGQLVGISRPVINEGEGFLKTDDVNDSVDTGLYSSRGFVNEEKTKPANDDYFRKCIRSQIIKNNISSYSVNDLEFIAQLICGDDIVKTFYTRPHGKNFQELDLYVNEDLSHYSKAVFLQQQPNRNGQLMYVFPWPPNVVINSLIDVM